MRTAIFFGVLATLAIAPKAHAWPEGPADDRNVGRISGRAGLTYTMLAPSSVTLNESSGITSETISPSGVIHGFDFFGGLIFPRFQTELWLGMSFGSNRSVDAVTLGPDYDGGAYLRGALPGADVLVLRAKLLLGPRLPLGSFALSAGPGVGIEDWIASPHDGGKQTSSGTLVASERANQGMMTLPLYAQVAWKPTCGFVATFTLFETIGLTGAKLSYPGLSLGVAAENCQGTDVTMHLVWRRDGAHAGDFERDRYACVKENTLTITSAMGDASTTNEVGTNRTDWNMVDLCLQARGWRQLWEPVGPANESN